VRGWDIVPTFQKYLSLRINKFLNQKYVASKPWVKDNYLKIPDRMPNWIYNYA
jgi:hypothetical protein